MPFEASDFSFRMKLSFKLIWKVLLSKINPKSHESAYILIVFLYKIVFFGIESNVQQFLWNTLFLKEDGDHKFSVAPPLGITLGNILENISFPLLSSSLYSKLGLYGCLIICIVKV